MHHCRHFRFSAFPFFPRKSGRWVLQKWIHSGRLQATDWNKLVDIGTQREYASFDAYQTEAELKQKCVNAITSDDYTDNHTVFLHVEEDCPEYYHLFLQHNPQLFWWTPISGFTPTSQLQEGHEIALLQQSELQWSAQPESVQFLSVNEGAASNSIRGIQLRSFRPANTDFKYNPTITFGLTTTTYADSSWIKMDAILDVKRTIHVQFSFDDAANFNINPYIDQTLLACTIKHYYNYNSNPRLRCFRPGPKMAFKHKRKQDKFLPYKVLKKMGIWGKRPAGTSSESMAVPFSMFKRMMWRA